MHEERLETLCVERVETQPTPQGGSGRRAVKKPPLLIAPPIRRIALPPFLHLARGDPLRKGTHVRAQASRKNG